MKIENRMQLHLWREECKEKRQKETCRVLICGGTGCLAGGSDKIYARIKELTANMSNVTVKFGEEIAHVGLKMSGCHGFCEMGPLVRIEPYNYLYLKVKLEDCEEIFEKTILRGEPVTRLMYEDSGRVYETQEEAAATAAELGGRILALLQALPLLQELLDCFAGYLQ